MKLTFSKRKYIGSLFYHKVENAFVEIFEDKIVVWSGQINYSGTFYLKAVRSNDAEKIVYMAMSQDVELVIGAETYIAVFHNYRKFMLFDRNNDGIFLKN